MKNNGETMCGILGKGASLQGGIRIYRWQLDTRMWGCVNRCKMVRMVGNCGNGLAIVKIEKMVNIVEKCKL